jgi:hypothetical protein
MRIIMAPRPWILQALTEPNKRTELFIAIVITITVVNKPITVFVYGLT